MLSGLIEAHIVEDEELGFRAKKSRIGDPQGPNKLLSFLRKPPTVTRIDIVRSRIDHVAEYGKRRIVKKRVRKH